MTSAPIGAYPPGLWPARSAWATARSLKIFGELLSGRMAEMSALQKGQFESFAAGMANLTQTNEKKLEEMRGTMERKLTHLGTEAAQNSALGREEMGKGLKAFGDSLLARITEIAALQKDQLDTFAANLAMLTTSNEHKLEAVRQTVENKLTALQADNTQKLDQMRATVDEKLHATLEQRLTCSTSWPLTPAKSARRARCSIPYGTP